MIDKSYLVWITFTIHTTRTLVWCQLTADWWLVSILSNDWNTTKRSTALKLTLVSRVLVTYDSLLSNELGDDVYSLQDFHSMKPLSWGHSYWRNKTSNFFSQFFPLYIFINSRVSVIGSPLKSMSCVSEAVLLKIQNMSAYHFRPLTQIWNEETIN
jgi:hypothetical protein